ncbi:gag-pol polyprotein, partial [Trifolium medium]|nr:gag-pol polyprotein [Trifolium medium]
MESANVVIDDAPSPKREDVSGDAEPSIDLTDGTVQEEESDSNNEESAPAPVKAPSIRTQKNHPKELIIGDPN